MSRTTDAPFENRPDAERLGNPADVLFLAPEGKGGRARGDLEAGDVGQQVDDLLGQSVAEVLVIRVAAHVGEREHGDGWVLIGCLHHGLFQSRSDVHHRLEAIARLLGQTPDDDPFESRRRFQRRRRLVHDRREGRKRCVARERPAAT